MNIAKLFVSLGVKGGKQSKKQIDDATTGMKDLATGALAAKAAIIGALYATERLFSKSGQYGTSLTNFNALVGVSAKTLQQYQYAARQVGVSNEAVESSFKGLQSTLTKTLMGEGAPKGLARVAQVVAQVGKNMSPIDLKEFADDPTKLLQRLQEYAQLESNVGLRNETLRSFGLGDDVITALTRNAFTPDQLNKAPTYSDRDIAQLDKANIAWSNLGNKIEMIFGKLNARFGLKLVDDISKVTEQIAKMITSFTLLADKLKVFETIGKVFEGWDLIFKGISQGVDAITGEIGGTDAKGSNNISGFEQLKSLIDSTTGGDPEGKLAEVAMQLKGFVERVAGGNPIMPFSGGKAAPPNMPATVGNTGNTTNQVTVNQNLNFQHDGRDSQKTSDDLKRAVRNVFNQSYGIVQGN